MSVLSEPSLRSWDPRITIQRLTGNIGAEITGIDLAGPLGVDEVAALRNALLTHKVIFIRGQALDYEHLVALGSLFGLLTPGHPIYGWLAGKPHLRDMDSRGDGTRANYWHTDLTFADAPPAFAILHNVVCPPVGGDTIWANTAAAYRDLPEDLRVLADMMRVVHSNDSDYTDATYAYSAQAKAEYIERRISAEHPAVRVHPDTGERSLLLGGFARSVVGHRPRAGRELIGVLEDYATQPEYTVRWKWQVGDVVMWDNQSTMHYAVRDYGDEHRRALRITVAGSTTVGVDGRPGVAIDSAGEGFDDGATS